MLSHPLTHYMFCSPGEGAVALVMCRGDRAHRYTDRPVFLEAAVLRSRRFGSFEVFAPSLAVERRQPHRRRGRAAFDQAGIGPGDIHVAQVQDTESGAEVIHMAETGLCKHGEQEGLIKAGHTGIGGPMPINTDGGCMSQRRADQGLGPPPGLRERAAAPGRCRCRQVPGHPATAFTHVYGAPGVSACTVLAR